MSDSSQWQSPGGSAPPPSGDNPFDPPAPPGSFAPPPPPGGPAPSAYTPPQHQPGWTPPPKPGLIPLRPLTLGNILGASFQVMRRNPRPTFGLSLLITVGISLIGAAVIGLVVFFAMDRSFRAATAEDAQAIEAGTFAMALLSFMAILVLSIVGTAILQGIVSLEVARGTVGEKLRLKGLWRMARGRIGVLVGWSFLIAGAFFGAIVLIILVMAVLAVTAGAAGFIIGLFVYLFGLLAILVLACWLGTKLAFVPSALMLERLPLGAAIRRSWSLTRGYFWRTLGILALVQVMLNVAIQVITTPVAIIVALLTSVTNPNSDPDALIASMIVLYGITGVVTLLFSAIAAIVISATAALLYVDLRMRKEGLDLELSRFVEARQAGDESVADPYLPRAAWPQHPQPGSSTPSSSPWA